MGSLAPSMQVGKAAARVGCLTCGRSLFVCSCFSSEPVVVVSIVCCDEYWRADWTVLSIPFRGARRTNSWQADGSSCGIFLPIFCSALSRRGIRVSFVFEVVRRLVFLESFECCLRSEFQVRRQQPRLRPPSLVHRACLFLSRRVRESFVRSQTKLRTSTPVACTNVSCWQRHVLREDREFDAEAFVRAADAAAEDPQVCGVWGVAVAALVTACPWPLVMRLRCSKVVVSIKSR